MLSSRSRLGNVVFHLLLRLCKLLLQLVQRVAPIDEESAVGRTSEREWEWKREWEREWERVSGREGGECVRGGAWDDLPGIALAMVRRSVLHVLCCVCCVCVLCVCVLCCAVYFTV